MTHAKEGTHFMNKEVIKLSSGAEVKQDAKLDKAIGYVSQEVIGDLFKSSFAAMMSVEFI